MKFIVSVVMTKNSGGILNTQNKLYEIEAVSQPEAHGLTLPIAQADFPEHQFHTICSWILEEQESKPESVTELPLNDYHVWAIGSSGHPYKDSGTVPIPPGTKLYPLIEPGIVQVISNTDAIDCAYLKDHLDYVRKFTGPLAMHSLDIVRSALSQHDKLYTVSQYGANMTVYGVYAGLIEMKLHSIHISEQEAKQRASLIKSNAKVEELVVKLPNFPRSEVDRLSAAQAEAVMPMIGPLLDAWENVDTDITNEEVELTKWLNAINQAMEEAGD